MLYIYENQFWKFFISSILLIGNGTTEWFYVKDLHNTCHIPVYVNQSGHHYAFINEEPISETIRNPLKTHSVDDATLLAKILHR